MLSTFYQKSAFITSGDYLSAQTGAGNTITQVSRLQDLTWTINHPIQNQLYLDAGNETIEPTRPTFSCNLSWLSTNGLNERIAGLLTNGSSGALIDINAQKNVYIGTEVAEGYNYIGSNGNKTVIGLGQALLSAYSVSAQVGQPIQSAASFEGLNVVSYTGSSGESIPAVNYQLGTQLSGTKFTLPSATRQYDPTGSDESLWTAANIASDITMEFPVGSPFALALNSSQVNLQSFRANFSVNRQGLHKLGFAYPDARPTLYPVEVNLQMDALVNNYQAQALNNMTCYTTTGQEVSVLVENSCEGYYPIQFRLVGLQLKSQSSSVSIGSPFETVSLEWATTITDPFSHQNNIFIKDTSPIEILVIYEGGTEYPIETSDGYTLRAQQFGA
jgi:hypothetical protein